MRISHKKVLNENNNFRKLLENRLGHPVPDVSQGKLHMLHRCLQTIVQITF